MKKINILVEGRADLNFLKFYIKHLDKTFFVKKDISDDDNKELELEKEDSVDIKIIRTAYSNTNNIKTLLQKYFDDGCTNIIIFDSDDSFQNKKQEIYNSYNGLFTDLFLFPNNKDAGYFEDLLEKIIADKRPVDVWNKCEDIFVSRKLYILSKKTKIYVWLESIIGNTETKKKKCKELHRDYSDTQIWNLDSTYLDPLKNFLLKNIR